MKRFGLLILALTLLGLFTFSSHAQNQNKDVPPCPTCGANTEVVPIRYGKPAAVLIERADRGELKLGGCSKRKENWYCKKCKSNFEKL